MNLGNISRIFQIRTKERNLTEGKKNSHRDMCSNSKRANIYIIRVPGGEDKDSEIEKVFEKIMILQIWQTYILKRSRNAQVG